MTIESSQVLRGICILNTRPSHQQAELKRLLEADGARVLSFASIEIAAIEPTEFHLHLPENIKQYDMAIFVSRNAVDGAFQYLQGRQWPKDIQLAVIGEGTFQALTEKLDNADHRIIYGEPYNSESLLATEALNHVKAKNIIIFRGQQGRTLLGDTLIDRGARVKYCEVYRRQLPDYRGDDFHRLCATQFPSLAIFTSSEGMQNLTKMLDNDSLQRLLHSPWLLISERMRESAVNLGHNGDIIIAREASDEGIHQAILYWAQNHQSSMSEKKEQPAEESAESIDTVQSDAEATGKDIAEPVEADIAEVNSSQESEKPAEEKTERATPKPRRKIPWFGLFNFLLIIALIAAAAYYWQLQQKTEAEKQTAFDALKQQVAGKVENSQIQSKLRPLESGLTDLVNRLEQLQKHQQEMQESTEKLYELFGRDENAWQLAEVEYLMRIAQHKLILENDFEGAAVTLQAASDRIATTGDMGLLPVRVKISDEIAELKTRRRPDLVGMTLKLSQLGQQIRSLTPGFKAQPVVDAPKAEVVEETSQSLQDRARKFLDSLISVKRGVEMAPTKTEALIINIGERLEDNLKLTRWAVLERDAFQYKRLMKQNVELFQQFYNLDDAANHDFHSQLQALQQSEIKPEKPDINGSLEMLRKIITKREEADQQQITGDGDNV